MSSTAKDVVHGYIHDVQKILDDEETNLKIPADVESLCLLFLSKIEYWTLFNEKQVELQGEMDKIYMTEMPLCFIHGFMNIDMEQKGIIHRWTLKVDYSTRYGPLYLGIGTGFSLENKELLGIACLYNCKDGTITEDGEEFFYSIPCHDDQGDIIDIEVDVDTRTSLTFYTNNVNQGVAFNDIDQCIFEFPIKYHLIVGLGSYGDNVEIIDYQRNAKKFSQ